MSNLPGSTRVARIGAICEDCKKPATLTVQGETDSFGAEYHDMCKQCYDMMQVLSKAMRGTCDWCHYGPYDLVVVRNYEEGQHGPIYYICPACRARQLEQQRLDLDASVVGRDYEYFEWE